MQEHWENLPYGSTQRLPITATIPYFFRWKIYAIKVFLADLKILHEKYGIKAAALLSEHIKEEAEELCIQLAYEIKIMQNRRYQLGKRKKTV